MNQEVEGKFNSATDFLGVLSLGGVVLSGILLFTPVKAMGYIGVGGSLGAFGASIITRKKHLKVADIEMEKLVKHHKTEVDLHNELLLVKDTEIATLKADFSKGFNRIEELNQQLNQSTEQATKLQSQIDVLKAQNQSKDNIIEKVTGELDRLIGLARTAVEESLDEWNTRLDSLLSTKKEQYPKLQGRLSELRHESKQIIYEYSGKLQNVPDKWDSLADLLSLYYCANDDLQNIRIKAIQATGKLATQEKELELREVEEILEEWQTANLVPRDKLEHIIKNYEAALNEFRLEFSNRFDATHQFALALEGQSQEDDKFVQGIIAKMQELERQIHHLSKPLEWRPATRGDMKIGNVFIRYFEQLGVILDRAGIDYNQHESTLWFFTDRNQRLILPDDLNEHSDKLQALSHCLNVPKFALDPESGLIYVKVTLSKKPTVKDVDVSLMAGSPEEFISYITSHPIRYRLIADPGEGKTPTTAVMVSEILKVGGTRGNTGKGKKIPHTLVTVSCPDVESSQKDADYPLELFLKYGNTTAAVKSIGDAIDDWQYRKRDTLYAENFFQLWVWDELDNTLSSASDPKAAGEDFKKILKQAHHTGVGWIVSGQSVMTSQIPGFMDDDRELFTQIVVGANKIRKYLEKYGKKVLSAKVVTQLQSNLDNLDPYIEEKNSMITDAARLLRLALVLDDKSPKLYFLPNLDSAKFDPEKVENVITQADQMKRQFLVRAAGKNGSGLANEAQNACVESGGRMAVDPPFPTIGGSDHSSPSSQIPHCPHCGGSDLKAIESGKRYQCKGCTKRFVTSKVVWK